MCNKRQLQGDVSASAPPADSSSSSSNSVESADNGSSAHSSTASSISTSHYNVSISEAATDISHLRLQHDNTDVSKDEKEEEHEVFVSEQSQEEDEDHRLDAIASTSSEEDSDVAEGSASRRSGRQRKAIDHLQYPASTSPASVPTAKRKHTSTTSVSSTAKKVKHPSSSSRGTHEESTQPNVVVDDSDEVQIAALLSATGSVQPQIRSSDRVVLFNNVGKSSSSCGRPRRQSG